METRVLIASIPDLKPFLVLGLALGGVFAMSGVGLVVLYRATGVLNLAYGAIGAVGALVSWSLLDRTGTPEPVAYLACIAFGGVATLVYGLIAGPPFAARDPLVKATGNARAAPDPGRDHAVGLGPGRALAHPADDRLELPGRRASASAGRRSSGSPSRSSSPPERPSFSRRRRSGRRCDRSRTTARSPPPSAFPSVVSRRPPGSARASSVAHRGFCSRTSSASTSQG